MLMRDRIFGYLNYISTVWPVTYPGLTIEYGCENYGPLSIYVMVKYDDFCIKRIFGIDDMSDYDDAYFNVICNTIKAIRDEVMEKGERNGAIRYFAEREMRAVHSIDYNRVPPLPLIKTRPMPMPKPKKIILNDPATIILWSDNTKTIVKKNSKDKKFDPEKGIALCYMKKALGNKGNYNNVFKEWIK